MDTIKKGDIYIAEVGGARPVIVIQNNLSLQHSPYVYVVPLTSNLTLANSKYSVLIEDTFTNHKRPALIRCDLLRQVDKKSLHNKVGYVNQSTLTQISNSLALFLDIPQIAPQQEESEPAEVFFDSPEKMMALFSNLNDFVTDYKEDNRPINIWKNRLVDSLIGFIVGLLLPFIGKLLWELFLYIRN